MANHLRMIPAVRKPSKPPVTVQEQLAAALWELQELQHSDDATIVEIRNAGRLVEALRHAARRHPMRSALAAWKRTEADIAQIANQRSV